MENFIGSNEKIRFINFQEQNHSIEDKYEQPNIIGSEKTEHESLIYTCAFTQVQGRLSIWKRENNS